MIAQPINIPVSKNRYELVHPYIYEWMHTDGNRYKLTIPAGFRNDGASIPRPFWSLIGLTPDGLIRAAALVHDYLIVRKGCVTQHNLQLYVYGQWLPTSLCFSKLEADQLFRQIMKESNISKTKRDIAYRAIRFYTLFRNYNWKKK